LETAWLRDKLAQTPWRWARPSDALAAAEAAASIAADAGADGGDAAAAAARVRCEALCEAAASAALVESVCWMGREALGEGRELSSFVAGETGRWLRLPRAALEGAVAEASARVWPGRCTHAKHRRRLTAHSHP
jgi:hypothetical protein